ncbi:unnamed protein product [Camellia sinensis]
MISEANKNGPYLGLVTLNPFEMNPLLQSPSFTSSNLTIDFQGRKFRFGKIDEKDVILVMTGPGMVRSFFTSLLRVLYTQVRAQKVSSNSSYCVSHA